VGIRVGFSPSEGAKEPASDARQEDASIAGAPLALVLGGGVTALGVVRCLGWRGVPLLCATDPHDIAGGSRWYRQAPAQTPGEPLVEYLGRLPLDGAVLIPCSDHHMLQASALAGDLAARFPTSAPAPGVLGMLLDKASLAEALVAAGVPHPDTFVAREAADLEAVPDGVWQDAFLKPRDSQKFYARYGVKAMRVGSKAQACAMLRDLAASGLGMLVQEYIPGPASRHVFVDGFVDRRGHVCALLSRRRLRMYPPDFGNSSYMVSVPLADVEPAGRAIADLLKHLGYRGLFSAEFKQDERDGAFKLLEVNVRPWWYVEFAAQCGVNVPLMMYEDAQGHPVAEASEFLAGETLVYPYYDFFARREAGVSLVKWFRTCITSHQPVFSWDDPWPAVRATGRWVRSHFPRLVRSQWLAR
jgi:D-aspartate ligase